MGEAYARMLKSEFGITSDAYWKGFIRSPNDFKDINEMVLNGFSPDEIQDIISNNTFVNLRAKMEFVNWKKV
jgi:hypothetical protein